MPLIIVLFPMLTMYDSNRNANPLCVVNSIFSSTWSSIENSNDPCCVVHHPLVADLKTASGVLGADIANQVCPFKDGTILFLYSSTPTILKAIERTGAYQFDALTFSPDFQDNFCRPQVYPSRHAGNENRHVIGDCKSDFLFQFPFYYTFRHRQLLWPVACKTNSMLPLFGFCHSEHHLPIHHSMDVFTLQVVSILQLNLGVKCY